MTGEDVAARVHAYAWTDRKPGLERTRALLAALGNPEKALKFVHITGSNGKGSTAAMLASVLQRAGYRTGLYTSPHLLRFHERMRVCGREIDDASLIALTNTVRTAAEGVKGYYPAFDITPPHLVSGVVTDLGIYSPYDLHRYFTDGHIDEHNLVV